MRFVKVRKNLEEPDENCRAEMFVQMCRVVVWPDP